MYPFLSKEARKQGAEGTSVTDFFVALGICVAGALVAVGAWAISGIRRNKGVAEIVVFLIATTIIAVAVKNYDYELRSLVWFLVAGVIVSGLFLLFEYITREKE